MHEDHFETPGGISVTRTTSTLPYEHGLDDLLWQLDTCRGVYLSSGTEYKDRYSRWDIASVRPPLEVVAFEREMRFRPLNRRGEALCCILYHVLADHPHWESLELVDGAIEGALQPLPELFPEEERSKQPSAFTIIRALIHEFQVCNDPHLGLIGAFGFDLLYRFDPIEQKKPRERRQDLHLFLCDDIHFMDRKKELIERYQYDFALGEHSTAGLARTADPVPEPQRLPPGEIVSDHMPEEYMANVDAVREGTRRGDYYEVVLRQTFSTPFHDKPSALFERIHTASPSPYQFLLQFGDEQLVGASPEMYVQVEGRKVETAPISGTASRTGDPIRDAENIRDLLASPKEESELTMCTDVDRNDKSRVSVPGSVEVVERRTIESYAGVFHTVDHVRSTLAEGFDSLDAFLAHMWAVTMIGAPKKAAAQAVEDLEKDERGWYGGAIGMISLNGNMNTGILIRTVHLRGGKAYYPVGATLLFDSVSATEERETRLKATAFFCAIQPKPPDEKVDSIAAARSGEGMKLLLVDNADCFIHTLSNYARQTGAEVVTYRAGFPLELIDKVSPDLILISPGPGRPRDFGVPKVVKYAAERKFPVFGVCLGLQGMVEAFGGELGVLDKPMHGKPSVVRHSGAGVFGGLPTEFKVGRYHSLFAKRETFPECLEITAETVGDGVIMGARHRELPVEAVQFHPESILTLEEDCGLRLIENMVRIYGGYRR